MSATLKPTLRERLFVALQHALPQHFLSRVVLRVTRIRLWPVKNLLIKSFVRGFKPNMTEATQPNPLNYPSFNAFFTRTLRPGARPSDVRNQECPGSCEHSPGPPPRCLGRHTQRRTGRAQTSDCD